MATLDDLVKQYGGRPEEGAGTLEDLEKQYAARFAATTQPVASAPASRTESAATTRGRNATGAVRGFASAMQGPTFGFADEIFGGLKAAASVGLRDIPQALREGLTMTPGPLQERVRQTYRDNRDFARGAAKQESEDNPIYSKATQLAASAPTMLVGPLKSATGVLSQSLQAAKTGGIFGLLSGAGNSTAELSQDPGQVLLDTAVQGATGAALSGAATPLMRGIGAVGGNIASRVNPGIAEQHATSKVAEALLRDARGNVAQASPDAALGQAGARLRRLGPEARLVDAGDQNAKGLLDVLATLPGQTKTAAEQAIRTRQAGRADRLIGAADDSLRLSGDRAAQVTADLVEMRSQAATPLYARVHSMEVQANPELVRMVEAAQKLGANRAAEQIATAKEVPYTLAKLSEGQTVAMRDLDHLKQGLDELIAKHTKEGQLTPTGAAVQGLKTRLTAVLDDLTGGVYKEARDAFAGPTALISASNKGRNFLAADDASTRAVLQGMSQSEADAFRIGAYEALRAKLGTPGGQTEVLGMWKNKTLREKLSTIFPDERAFREFATSAAGEARMKGIESVGRGAQTAARHFAAGDLDVAATRDMGQLAAAAASGSPWGLLAAGTQAWNRVQTPEPVRDAMGRILLSQGPEAQARLLGLSDVMQQVSRSRANQAAGLGLLGGTVGAPSF